MTDETPGIGHNSGDEAPETFRVAASELRSFVERFEALEAEKKDLTDGQKEVMAEAKARGYDTKIIRKVVQIRKRDKDDLAEQNAVLDMYLNAMGMDAVVANMLS